VLAEIKAAEDRLFLHDARVMRDVAALARGQ